MGCEVLDAGFSFLWREGACNSLHTRGGMGFGERRGEVLGEVLGRRDVSAEEDRMVAVLDKRIDDGDGSLELGVAVHAAECGRLGGEGAQATSRRGVGALII